MGAYRHPSIPSVLRLVARLGIFLLLMQARTQPALDDGDEDEDRDAVGLVCRLMAVADYCVPVAGIQGCLGPRETS